ncbi:MAG: hypothetical protein JWR35_2493 [Marmoricola sp.]|jgi:hypothetical protein|nr:hypothetical protein [Marmoricola sp.]
MEAFFVAVMAAVILGLGGLALLGVRRLVAADANARGDA